MLTIVGDNRIILHIDMDSFFASIEVRENPALKGKPVVVGSDPKEGKGRGVVSTCSYEARKYGIRSGMPISRAFHFCPNAIFLPVNFELYLHVSKNVMEILKRYADCFEQVGIDEAFLDISSTESLESARHLAQKMKEEIYEKERLTCSIGIGPSKIVAKIASDFTKPNGLTIVNPERVNEFLSPLKVGKIPGIGRKTEQALNDVGIDTIGQLATHDVQKLQSLFGKWGVYMHELALGRDSSAVREDVAFKSLSREHTFDEDTDDLAVIHQTINEIVDDLSSTLVVERIFFRTLTIKVRFSGFITHTKSLSLPHYTQDPSRIKKLAKDLLTSFLNRDKIRLIGIKLSNLEIAMGQTTIEDFLK